MSLLFMTEKCWAFTVVRFEPATIIVGPDYCMGEIFTLTVRIDSVEDLYGFQLRIEWNTTYLEYVAHVAKIPVETYSDGVLHEPLILVTDVFNPIIGNYLLAVTSLAPAPSFYGSGIVFEIDFAVKYQPLNPEDNAIIPVAFIEHSLVSTAGLIYHSAENCTVTIVSFHPADFNNDMKVDIFDIVLIAREFGKYWHQPDWDPIFDVSEPYGVIDIFDVVVVAGSYGQEYIPIT
jgi:hypothetical protein